MDDIRCMGVLSYNTCTTLALHVVGEGLSLVLDLELEWRKNPSDHSWRRKEEDDNDEFEFLEFVFHFKRLSSLSITRELFSIPKESDLIHSFE